MNRKKIEELIITEMNKINYRELFKKLEVDMPCEIMATYEDLFDDISVRYNTTLGMLTEAKDNFNKIYENHFKEDEDLFNDSKFSVRVFNPKQIYDEAFDILDDLKMIFHVIVRLGEDLRDKALHDLMFHGKAPLYIHEFTHKDIFNMVGIITKKIEGTIHSVKLLAYEKQVIITDLLDANEHILKTTIDRMDFKNNILDQEVEEVADKKEKIQFIDNFRDMDKYLTDLGYEFDKVGEHHNYVNPKTGHKIAVPKHSKDFGKGLAMKIMKQARLGLSSLNIEEVQA